MSAAGLGAPPRSRLPAPTRRELIAGSLLLAGTAASQWLKPTRQFAPLTYDQLADAIPTQIGNYRFATTSGLVLPARDELSDRLYDEVLARTYVAPGQPPIMALLAYGSVQNLSLELHRPEECYPQQGFAITAPQSMPLHLGGHQIPASALTARRPGGYVEQLVFWSRIGAHFPEDKTSQSWIVARENFAGRMPDGLLVRISVPVPDRAQGEEAAQSFLQDLDRALSPIGRKIVFGEAEKGVIAT